MEAVEDVGQNTPATVINEQQAVPEPASPQNGERAFLQGMSPPSSPGGLALKDSPVAQASDNDPPVPVVSDTVAKETVITPPAVLPAGELGEGDSVVPRTDGGVVAVPSVEPSTGGRRTGGGGELTEDGEGGGSARATGRSVELILRPGGLQVSPHAEGRQSIVIADSTAAVAVCAVRVSCIGSVAKPRTRGLKAVPYKKTVCRQGRGEVALRTSVRASVRLCFSIQRCGPRDVCVSLNLGEEYTTSSKIHSIVCWQIRKQ